MTTPRIIFTAFITAAICAHALVACDSTNSANDPDASATDSDTDTETDTGDDPLDVFFSLDAVHDIEIHVGQDAYDSLVDNPKTYVHAQVRIDDVEFEDVGLRLKGGFGSFTPIDETESPEWGNSAPGKSGFIVDFNRYVNGQNFLTLKKLTLNNIKQDPSGIEQYLGYELFRAGNVPASRSGFGRIAFNGVDKYLYALIETPDNDEFLEKWYGSDDGNLYEGAGSDLTGDSFDYFDQDNGDDTSKDDLLQIATALDAIEPGDDIMAALGEYLDVEEYLTFAATEMYLAHWDGYAWSTNNFMIHHNLADDTWTYLPWGIDQLFDSEELLGGYEGVMKSPGPSWESPKFGLDAMFSGGRVHALCIYFEECSEQLHQAFLDVIDRAEQIDLRGIALDARDLVEPVMHEEAQEFGDPGTVDYYMDQVVDFIDGREEALTQWLPCLIGEFVDNDNDTFNACTEDCNDLDLGVHPGATEVCNYRDDDCNEVIDDGPGCPDCIDVTGNDAESYSLCFHEASWSDARQSCIDKGLELASIHDETTGTQLVYDLIGNTGIYESWIGLNDIALEGTFTWTDGSPLDWENWIVVFPPEWAQYLDCVSYHAILGWMTYPCDEERAFMCKAP